MKDFLRILVKNCSDPIALCAPKRRFKHYGPPVIMHKRVLAITVLAVALRFSQVSSLLIASLCSHRFGLASCETQVTQMAPLSGTKWGMSKWSQWGRNRPRNRMRWKRFGPAWCAVQALRRPFAIRGLIAVLSGRVKLQSAQPTQSFCL